jgi:signal peptidase I
MADNDKADGWWSALKRLAFGRRPARTLVRAVVLAVVVVGTCRFILLPVRIAGLSMEPTYHDHSINFVNRLAYVFGRPRRGDVVAVRYSRPRGFSSPHIMLLKRVIGLPGETVAINDGAVLINGELLDEPYVKQREAWQLSAVKLADDEYFLIGDNRGMDQRYHEFGRTESKRIVGKVLW